MLQIISLRAENYNYGETIGNCYIHILVHVVNSLATIFGQYDSKLHFTHKKKDFELKIVPLNNIIIYEKEK